MSKWYLKDLEIFEYEEYKVASKNLVNNREHEIEYLNKRINQLKIEERKSENRGWINDKEEKNKSDESSTIFKGKYGNYQNIVLGFSWVFVFLLHVP